MNTSNRFSRRPGTATTSVNITITKVVSGHAPTLEKDLCDIAENFSAEELALIAKCGRNAFYKGIAVSNLKKHLG